MQYQYLLKVISNTKWGPKNLHNGFMTNSTPNFIAWLAEYQKYLDLVDKSAFDDAADLKQEIEEGLKWVELTWSDLEFASNQGSQAR